MNILIVDDDPVTRRLLAQALRKEGLGVTECRDGVEALGILEKTREALLVLDYEMPELNGAQICGIIRNDPDTEIAGTPIILLTGHSGQEHEIECLEAGANDFVVKPVNTAVLKARIDTHLRLHALHRQLQEQKRELEEWRNAREMDLEAARLTQQAIIPQRLPALPGWRFAARYLPLIQVGGDIYDWLRMSDGGLLLWIADATGHGAAAALLTTLAKLLFRHASSEAQSPEEVLRSVSQEFFSIFRGKSFMTAALVRLNLGSDRVQLCAAGHPPILIGRADGTVESLRSSGPPLGLTAESKAEQIETRIAPGEAIVLNTDGLYAKRAGGNGHEVPAKAMREFLARGSGPPEALIEHLLEQARQQMADKPIDDDIAAVVAMRE